ncbi:FAD/NAD(P)-binding domain-containing protein [Mycena kentingensis (nom. inval.)]|nr:FAD/NAD(P)-binding domain-containing protein [Mycena kentingensis (nom. inval.)]
MSGLKVLIVGAGMAGPAFAYLLQRSNPRHQITIIERFPGIRGAGQQVDVKNQGVKILHRMDLLEAFKSKCVNEEGLEIVDSNGSVLGTFGVSPAGEQHVGLTSEYEIMRGDYVQLLHDATREQNARLSGSLKYEFGQEITDLKQDANQVEVTFSNGKKGRYDLVVGADGQSSRTRRLAFGRAESEAAMYSYGVHVAYYSIPRVPGEGTLARAYNFPGGAVLTRNNNRPRTQILLFTNAAEHAASIRASYTQPVDAQRAAFTKAFRGAGWDIERMLDGAQSTDDFYSSELAQVRMKEMTKGRVALVGDAGSCPTPFTGQGLTLSLITSYVLAGELARAGNDVPRALEAFNRVVRPGIDEAQQLSRTTMKILLPGSSMGVWLLQTLTWMYSKVQHLVPQSTDGASTDGYGGKWKIPDYPELNLRK